MYIGHLFAYAMSVLLMGELFYKCTCNSVYLLYTVRDLVHECVIKLVT